MAKTLKIIPLGGLGEIGKNMMVVQYGDDIIVIDAGLMFPDEEMLGIDLVLPDFTYLRNNQEKIHGIVITHGHEDHTGSLPYLLKEVNVPVYGTRLTLGLIEAKLAEHRLLGEAQLHEMSAGREIKLGPFRIEPIPVVHSIPDGVGLAIHTPVGTIVHTGDFKFDQTPVDGRLTDISRLSALGNDNVLALLSDSTRAEKPGITQAERSVGHTFDELFEEAKNRVVVACFASHIHRIQQVISAAAAHGRKVAVVGRSVVTNVEIASRLGYLKIPEDLIIDMRDVGKYRPRQVLIMCTGSQGEPMSALTRMASHDHKHVQIQPGDTVILSATPVPGNEKSVSRTINELFRCGAEVFYESVAGVHVSGHASAEELKLMINLVRPKYFIPIHGEMRHLKHHAQIAEYVGIPKSNIILAENGDVISFTARGQARKDGKIPSGVIFVDGLGVGDIGNIVLRDRQHLARDGICIVVLSVNSQTGEVISGPDIICRGFVYVKESIALIEEAKERVRESFTASAQETVTDFTILKSHARDVLSRFFFERTMRRPMIIPIVMEV